MISVRCSRRLVWRPPAATSRRRNPKDARVGPWVWKNASGNWTSVPGPCFRRGSATAGSMSPGANAEGSRRWPAEITMRGRRNQSIAFWLHHPGFVRRVASHVTMTGMESMKRLITPVALGLGALMSLAACTNPYDPGQRAVGGAALGAGTGALIGGAAGGGRGALTGALIGGTVGAVGGVAT